MGLPNIYDVESTLLPERKGKALDVRNWMAPPRVSPTRRNWLIQSLTWVHDTKVMLVVKTRERNRRYLMGSAQGWVYRIFTIN